MEGLAAAKIQVPAGSSGATMDLKDMPAPIRDIMRAAYGDAIAQIFLISAIIGLVALVAILFIKERPLRRTVDITAEPAERGADAAAAAAGSAAATAPGTAGIDPGAQSDGYRSYGPRSDAGIPGSAASPDGSASVSGIVDLDREFIEVLSRQRASESRFPDAARPDAGLPNAGLAATAQQGSNEDRASDREGARARARTLVADARADAADVVPVLLQTQQLLAEQQLQLADALRAVYEQAAEQRAIAAEQARVSEELTVLRRQLAKERKLQRAAAEYIATHGRHRND